MQHLWPILFTFFICAFYACFSSLFLANQGSFAFFPRFFPKNYFSVLLISYYLCSLFQWLLLFIIFLLPLGILDSFSNYVVSTHSLLIFSSDFLTEAYKAIVSSLTGINQSLQRLLRCMPQLLMCSFHHHSILVFSLDFSDLHIFPVCVCLCRFLVLGEFSEVWGFVAVPVCLPAVGLDSRV